MHRCSCCKYDCSVYAKFVPHWTAAMASRALTTTLVLLLAASSTFCRKMSSENKDSCLQEATASSSVSEEDKEKALEINRQVYRELHMMFWEERNESMKELKDKDMAGEKVDAAEDIKDKVAAKNFLKAYQQCTMNKEWVFKWCQKAKEVNNDSLPVEDLRKVTMAFKVAFQGSPHPVNLEKKLTEAVGSDEKAKVAVAVFEALLECRRDTRKASMKEGVRFVERKKRPTDTALGRDI
ncbi:hypothetical protein V5799_021646 [Amblyomma americanum]|uniref:Uncharacterized protein n=1 Tax=Amblyomma americanum TaxID=6943 RepID=A0AAQ4FQ04_AMBAM